jgi:hypothetical protein
MHRLQTLDLSNLPSREDDRLEFKSSLIGFTDLQKRIERAASAFWNTGGGTLIVGVNDCGKSDGGIPVLKGNQPIRAWVDLIIEGVKPTGKYDVRLWEHGSTGSINPDHCVLGIEFAESRDLPHMAPDHNYYIRAGEHTHSASHYIVEALWARRRSIRPVLMHTVRFNPNGSAWVQLGVVALNDVPALDVSLTLDPVPKLWADPASPFPLLLPLVDRANPFFMDLVVAGMQDRDLGKDVRLTLEYRDEVGNTYAYSKLLDVGQALGLWKTETPSEAILKAAEAMNRTLGELTRAIRESRT